MPIKFVDMANFWYRSFNNSETYYTILFLIIMICFDYNNNGYLPSFKDYSNDWKKLVTKNLKDPVIDIDNYVIDMHTKLGKSLGYKRNLKGKEFFMYEGSKVNDQMKLTMFMKELKNFYMFKGLFDFGKIESKFYITNNK